MVTEQRVPPVTLTEAAVEAFRKLVHQKNYERAGLKVAVGPGGCGGFQYKLGIARQPAATDLESESMGISLYLDTKTLGLYQGCVIDFKEGLMGAGFSVSNPNSKADCACGQSFKVSGSGPVDSGGCVSSVAGRS